MAGETGILRANYMDTDYNLGEEAFYIEEKNIQKCIYDKVSGSVVLEVDNIKDDVIQKVKKHAFESLEKVVEKELNFDNDRAISRPTGSVTVVDNEKFYLSIKYKWYFLDDELYYLKDFSENFIKNTYTAKFNLFKPKTTVEKAREVVKDLLEIGFYIGLIMIPEVSTTSVGVIRLANISFKYVGNSLKILENLIKINDVIGNKEFKTSNLNLMKLILENVASSIGDIIDKTCNSISGGSYGDNFARKIIEEHSFTVYTYVMAVSGAVGASKNFVELFSVEYKAISIGNNYALAKYFSDKSGLDDASVKRWLENLKKGKNLSNGQNKKFIKKLGSFYNEEFVKNLNNYSKNINKLNVSLSASVKMMSLYKSTPLVLKKLFGEYDGVSVEKTKEIGQGKEKYVYDIEMIMKNTRANSEVIINFKKENIISLNLRYNSKDSSQRVVSRNFVLYIEGFLPFSDFESEEKFYAIFSDRNKEIKINLKIDRFKENNHIDSLEIIDVMLLDFKESYELDKSLDKYIMLMKPRYNNKNNIIRTVNESIN